MKHFFKGLAIVFHAFVLIGATELAVAAPAAQSEWVNAGKDGKLHYKTLATGDKIMDFSSAGYMGGGVPLPSVPVKAEIAPSGGDDDTLAIQAALDSVAKLELANGFRGAVVLKAGTFKCTRPLVINASGVVLRGSGSGANGTVIMMTGNPHVCFSIFGSRSSGEPGESIAIADEYVPSGATSLHVTNAAALKVGDTIVIRRPVTDAWVKFMGMDTLVRNGQKETWLSDEGDTETERVIKAISGNQITLDIPLTDSIDSKFLNPPGASLAKVAVANRISQVGIESLHIISPPQAVEITQRQNQAIRMNGVSDAWLRDIAIEDTVNSVGIGGNAKRITVETVSIGHRVPTKGSAKPADFTGGGTQLLFDRCSSTGSNIFYFVTGARVTGPIVLLNCTFHGDGHVQPHARWATGLLVDGCHVPESGIDFMNRGEMGSGHGWTIGWAVAWNCVAKSYIIQQPPGSANWAIGCVGTPAIVGRPFEYDTKLPQGIFESNGTPVTPASLYLAQLRERLGPQAVKNIGY